MRDGNLGRWLLCLAVVSTACGEGGDKKTASEVTGETQQQTARATNKASRPATKPVPDAATLRPRTPTPKSAVTAQEFTAKLWVRTTMFDGSPFIGFTYIDRSKGPSIKGVPTKGLTEAEWARKLRAAPRHTLQPIPKGHLVTPLTSAEVRKLGLPARPGWLAMFEGRSSPYVVKNKQAKKAMPPRKACIEVAKLLVKCSSEMTAAGGGKLSASVTTAGGPPAFCRPSRTYSLFSRFWPVCPASDCGAFARCIAGK